MLGGSPGSGTGNYGAVTVTDLTEACADLQAWLPVAAALITQPDTQPAIGHTQPHSKPPWNAEA
jgi:hypothetical protein